MIADKSITLMVKDTQHNVEFPVVPYDDQRSFICTQEEKDFLKSYLPGKMITFIPREAEVPVKIPLFEFYCECVMRIQSMPEYVVFTYAGKETMTDDSMSAQSIFQLNGIKFDMIKTIEKCSSHGQVINFVRFAEALSSLQAELEEGRVWNSYEDRFYTIYSYFEGIDSVKH